MSTQATFSREAHRTADKDRAIQSQVDKADGKKSRSKSEKAPQTGQREYPVPPFPKQHHSKPGIEADIDPRPMYEAPGYKGSDKLLDKVALITGGDSGIGRGVAVLYAREGADVAIVYLDEHLDAEETKRAVEKESRRCILIPGDVSDPKFCAFAVEETVKKLGGLHINAMHGDGVRQGGLAAADLLTRLPPLAWDCRAATSSEKEFHGCGGRRLSRQPRQAQKISSIN